MARSLARSRTRAAGYTLIELMTVVALLALLASLAAPSFRNMIAAQRIRSASFDMVSDLVLARSEALKRGSTVQILPSGTDWVGGWRVQLLTTQKISQRNALGGGVEVTAAPESVRFNLNGRVVDADGQELSDPVRFAFSGGTRQSCIFLDPSGRPRSTTCPSSQ